MEGVPSMFLRQPVHLLREDFGTGQVVPQNVPPSSVCFRLRLFPEVRQ